MKTWIQAKEKDLPTINSYIDQEPVNTIFISADLYQYGLHHSFQTVWMIQEAEQIHGLFLKYYDNYVYYSQKQQVPSELIEAFLVEHDVKALGMTGSDYRTCEAVLKDRYQLDPCTTAVLHKPVTPSANKAVVAKAEDMKEILLALYSIKEFAHLKKDTPLEEEIQRKQQKLADGFQMHYIIKDGDMVIANANTSCTSPRAAIIGGVFCREGYRQKGYAKNCVSALCAKLQSKNILPCLFFVNPIAAKLYHDLGFVDCGEWMVMVR